MKGMIVLGVKLTVFSPFIVIEYGMFFALAVPKVLYPVFVKTSPKRTFSMTKNERFGPVFTKAGSINSGTVQMKSHGRVYNVHSTCL